ncbi:odorant receptor 49a-like [Leptopilina boulardi]|uniref:odorant receptor 49a-like n=1 Tax=Leptopilina boulardi TaxID=63433 RepID=UPI0021F5C394|nr:odorant receptor 49a-like [Leptopilina boulardi]
MTPLLPNILDVVLPLNESRPKIYRLNHVVDENYHVSKSDPIKDSKIYERMIKCIQLHNDILNFSENIEVCFSNLFCFILGITMLLIGFQGVQIALNINNIQIVLRFGSLFLANIIHLFFTSIPGQMLIDKSSKVSQYCYESKWTDMTVETRKLLLFWMLRSSHECKISAGGIYVISMENFCSVVKTSFSFLSVLTSTQ